MFESHLPQAPGCPQMQEEGMERRWQKGRQTQSGIAFGKIVRYEVLT